MTGRGFDRIWRAPGGRTTPNTLKYAKECGYQHVGWTNAGFLGDELPSEQYPNDKLLKRALDEIRDGEILVMHTGIWSRAEPFAPMLDPLIAGLKAKGLCFARITEKPAVRR
jgi:peptidoglycan/xylan/chitin deacetylase (PgdA/CDA1 family)